MLEKSLVIGNGEVGHSLYEVLKDVYPLTWVRDIEEPKEPIPDTFQILHICFPPFKEFEETVKGYQKRYKPLLTVIHSTVAPGTCDRLKALHSPIHGQHKENKGLTRGILTFPKYIGGGTEEQRKELHAYFRYAGITPIIVDNAVTSELSKICCTTYLTLIVEYMHFVKHLSDKHSANFEQVYGWNTFYNHGYTRLHQNKFVRPKLDYIPGSCGGHCCLPNLELIKDERFVQMLKEMDKLYAQASKDD